MTQKEIVDIILNQRKEARALYDCMKEIGDTRQMDIADGKEKECNLLLHILGYREYTK